MAGPRAGSRSRNQRVRWQGPDSDILTPVPPWHQELRMLLWCLHEVPGCWERAAVLVLGHPCSLGRAWLWTMTLHPSFWQER